MAKKKVKRKKTNSAKSELDFEKALSELEIVVNDLEHGKLGLTDSIAKYEQGVQLLRQCHGALEQAERRIQILTRLESSGEIWTRNFEGEQEDDSDQSVGEGDRPGSEQVDDKGRLF